jgi:hypothetical protein
MHTALQLAALTAAGPPDPTGSLPLVNGPGLKGIAIGALALLLIFGGVIMAARHRSKNLKQQLESAGSAFVGIFMVACGLAAAVLLGGFQTLVGAIFH